MAEGCKEAEAGLGAIVDCGFEVVFGSEVVEDGSADGGCEYVAGQGAAPGYSGLCSKAARIIEWTN